MDCAIATVDCAIATVDYAIATLHHMIATVDCAIASADYMIATVDCAAAHLRCHDSRSICVHTCKLRCSISQGMVTITVVLLNNM